LVETALAATAGTHRCGEALLEAVLIHVHRARLSPRVIPGPSQFVALFLRDSAPLSGEAFRLCVRPFGPRRRVLGISAGPAPHNGSRRHSFNRIASNFTYSHLFRLFIPRPSRVIRINYPICPSRYL